MVAATLPTVASVRQLLDEVVDPDLPFLSIADIGILRGVDVDGDVVVTITPTYSGCPAMDTIESDIRSVLANAGIDKVDVQTVYTPAWTTEWLTETAKRKLASNGIAPPDSVLAVVPEVLCPRCASGNVELVSQFGSTACKAIMVCTGCREPFDSFKAI